MIQLVTYDDMDYIMRINMLGCNYLGYDTGIEEYDNLCDPSSLGVGWISPLYFVCFAIVCTLILMSALIGLSISSMEKLMEIKNAELEIWEDVKEVAKAYEIEDMAIPWLLSLFEDLDKENNCHLTFIQIQPLMKSVGFEDEQEQFSIFLKVDRDGSGQVEFPEFCELISIIGLILNKTPLAKKKARMNKHKGKFDDFDKEMDKKQETLVNGPVDIALVVKTVAAANAFKVGVNNSFSATKSKIVEEADPAIIDFIGNSKIIPDDSDIISESVESFYNTYNKAVTNMDSTINSMSNTLSSSDAAGVIPGRKKSMSTNKSFSVGISQGMSVKLLKNNKSAADRKVLRNLTKQSRKSTIDEHLDDIPPLGVVKLNSVETSLNRESPKVSKQSLDKSNNNSHNSSLEDNNISRRRLNTENTSFNVRNLPRLDEDDEKLSNFFEEVNAIINKSSKPKRINSPIMTKSTSIKVEDRIKESQKILKDHIRDDLVKPFDDNSNTTVGSSRFVSDNSLSIQHLTNEQPAANKYHLSTIDDSENSNLNRSISNRTNSSIRGSGKYDSDFFREVESMMSNSKLLPDSCVVEDFT